MLVNEYLTGKFGCKVYKIALNGGFTCPNRDGKLDTRGCIFCSAGGSGDFAENPELSITEQIEAGKKRVADKIKNGRYIAYFQAYTGTYAPVERLRSLFEEAVSHPDVAVLSVATRPDCLPPEVLDLLEELNRKKPVWVELGLQTIHERTAEYIRRGYPLSVYDRAVKDLRGRGIEVITHVILGLPLETAEDMVSTVEYVCRSGATGIKLQLLHILKGTDLEKEYMAGRVTPLSEDGYIEILKQCVKVIPEDVVIHRLTGDGDKKILTAPLWSGNKKHVLNRIRKEVLCNAYDGREKLSKHTGQDEVPGKGADDMEFTTDIFRQFDKKWALLTAGKEESFNTMTISWGGLGTLWNKPVATVYVRQSRLTHDFMDDNEYFTVSFYPEQYKKELGVLGSKSGRDMDKMKASGLTPVKAGESVSFKEAEVTLVCRKLFKQLIPAEKMPKDVVDRFYSDNDLHDMYIGEVVEILQ